MGHNSTSLSSLERQLVPDVVIFPKFKALEFEKYKGLNCPNIHMKMYVAQKRTPAPIPYFQYQYVAAA